MFSISGTKAIFNNINHFFLTTLQYHSRKKTQPIKTGTLWGAVCVRGLMISVLDGMTPKKCIFIFNDTLRDQLSNISTKTELPSSIFYRSDQGNDDEWDCYHQSMHLAWL